MPKLVSWSWMNILPFTLVQLCQLILFYEASRAETSNLHLVREKMSFSTTKFKYNFPAVFAFQRHLRAVHTGL